MSHHGSTEHSEEVVESPLDGHSVLHVDDLVHPLVRGGLFPQDVGEKLNGLQVRACPPLVMNGDGLEPLLPSIPGGAQVLAGEKVDRRRYRGRRKLMRPGGDTPGDLRVDIGDLGRGETVVMDQAVVHLFQSRWIEVDSQGSQPSIHPGQVPIPSKHLPPVNGRHLVDAVSE